MACTAMGIAGVAVAGAVVGITNSVGVIGVAVGLASAVDVAVMVEVSVGGCCTVGAAVGSEVPVAVAGTGIAGDPSEGLERPMTSKATASAPESAARTTDPRACTM